MNITPLAVGALHLGSLHPVEQALTLALAFGPFVVLGIVVLVRRRHHAVEEPAPSAQDLPQRER